MQSVEPVLGDAEDEEADAEEERLTHHVLERGLHGASDLRRVKVQQSGLCSSSRGRKLKLDTMQRYNCSYQNWDS